MSCPIFDVSGSLTKLAISGGTALALLFTYKYVLNQSVVFEFWAELEVSIQVQIPCVPLLVSSDPVGIQLVGIDSVCDQILA